MPCPSQMPAAGEWCHTDPSELCSYTDGCCPAELKCVDWQWQDLSPTCNPPAIECPESAPLDGDACDSCAFTIAPCVYDDCAGFAPSYSTATCQSGAWAVTTQSCG
jgi:hypothetical protein